MRYGIWGLPVMRWGVAEGMGCGLNFDHSLFRVLTTGDRL